MSGINVNVPVNHGVFGNPNIGNDTPNIDNRDESESNPFAFGFESLEVLLMAIQDIANNQYLAIQKSAERARKTQDMSNRMDEVIAEAAKGDDKTREKVPDDVIQYMRDNGITIDGMTIDEYIKQHGDGSGALDKGGLQAVKAALDNSANRDTDLMTQGQLTIQKMSQQMNAVITQLTGLLSKWGDISSQIAQKTYS